ncbi:MAG: acylphosphatase [Nitrospirae bacterium]|nr:acylphosphatase [Nitrospirota bacterium]
MSQRQSTRARILVSGLVQGVAYRAFAQREATRRGLGGEACNLDDGRVAVDVEGEREVVEAFIESLRTGPPLARVEDMQVQWEPPTGRHREFRIRY